MTEHRLPRQLFRLTIITLVLGAALLIDLDRLPALWWDEGWTMNVARTWVEQGHYAQLLNGQPAPPGLSAAFPSVLSVALSFKLFGIGAWQARLPSVIYTLIALGLLYWLGKRWFDHVVAITAIGLLLITSTDPFVSPIFMGRQVLAEPIMLACLLGGYVCLGLALAGGRWRLLTLLGAIGLFALGLIAKAQPLPFWIVSLMLPLIVTVVARQWSKAAMLALTWFGAYLAMQRGAIGLWTWLQPIASPPIPGLMDITAAVFVPQVRLTVVALTLQMALPTVIGLIAYGWPWLRAWRSPRSPAVRDVVRLMLFGFAASWLAWYVLLSRGAPRYAMPGLFVGSLFAAVVVVKAIGRVRQRGHVRLAVVASWVLISVLIAMVVLNLTWVVGLLRANVYPGVAAQDAAEYVNQQAPADALVETYESEVMFYLQRRYHFPPDETHVELVLQQLDEYNQSQAVSTSDLHVNYDPLAADPDYLIVGPPDNLWYAPYATVLNSGAFRLVFTAGRYQVLERVR